MNSEEKRADSLSIGIIGAGTRSLHVYREIIAAADGAVRLAAFVDPDPARADAVHALPGADKAVMLPTPEALIGHPGLNAVMIGSPNAFHAGPAIEVMQAGLPLFLEKPLAATLDDHHRLLKAYMDTNARVAVGFVLRYAPFYRAIKQHMPELGQILSLHASEHMGIDLTARTFLRCWRADRKVAGPLLLEKCCHDIDIINWLLDRPCEAVMAAGGRTAFVPRADRPAHCRDCSDDDCVYRAGGDRGLVTAGGERMYGKTGEVNDACVYNLPKDIDDHTTVLAEYAGGVQVSFNVTMGIARSERRIRIVGTRGMLAGCAEDNHLEFTPLARDAGTTVITPPPAGPGGHFGGDARLAADFVRIARDPAAEVSPSIPEGYRSGVICLAADLAAERGSRVCIEDIGTGHR